MPFGQNIPGLQSELQSAFDANYYLANGIHVFITASNNATEFASLKVPLNQLLTSFAIIYDQVNKILTTPGQSATGTMGGLRGYSKSYLTSWLNAVPSSVSLPEVSKLVGAAASAFVSLYQSTAATFKQRASSFIAGYVETPGTPTGGWQIQWGQPISGEIKVYVQDPSGGLFTGGGTTTIPANIEPPVQSVAEPGFFGDIQTLGIIGLVAVLALVLLKR